ncbi:nitroreductase family deazaflavin-dependent oxidoreductase [Nocardia sp. KC 131]|uniref:nitroreductase family deazaflavin-dependent oxidoreductase n=1 Tax=Nocardia arseniciresistens TaxID=3392119 RepID=UPI00398EE0F7
MLAGKVPPFGIVIHKGRKSGRAYRTPVWVFEGDGVYRIALTYGRDVDWVRNICAAGTFDMEIKGKVVSLVGPVVEHDPSATWAPVGLRQVLSTISATDYVQASPA